MSIIANRMIVRIFTAIGLFVFLFPNHCPVLEFLKINHLIWTTEPPPGIVPNPAHCCLSKGMLFRVPSGCRTQLQYPGCSSHILSLCFSASGSIKNPCSRLKRTGRSLYWKPSSGLILRCKSVRAVGRSWFLMSRRPSAFAPADKIILSARYSLPSAVLRIGRYRVYRN